jgi:uncharacterized protein YukE
MTDPLAVTPDGLRAAGNHLEEVSAKLKKVLMSLNAKLDAEGAAWGDDKAGHGFADGTGGYLAQVDWVDTSIKAKTDLLDEYSGTIRDTADTLEGQDQD